MINRILKFSMGTALLCLLFLCAGCNNSTKVAAEDNSWTGDNLRGKVKRLMEITYRAIDQNGEWVKGTRNQTYTVKSYSPQGFLLNERNYYSDNNEVYGGLDYIYDNEQNLLRINVIDPEGNLVSYSQIEKRDGKVGIRVYTDYYGEGDDAIITAKTEMAWENFRIISASTFDPNLQLVSTSAYEYDSRGDITLFSIKNEGGGQRDISVNYSYLKFDDTGNWTRQFKDYQGYPVKEIAERSYEYYE